nr:MAG TPA: hypothetical protein [Caudoviricetes sp.]
MATKQPKFDVIFGSSASTGEMLNEWPELEYLRGWGYLDKGEAPPLEYFNKLQNVSDLKSAYLFNSLNIRKSNTTYTNGDIVLSPNISKKFALYCSVGGDTAINEPDFSKAEIGSTFSDGSVTWEVIPRACKITIASEQTIKSMVKEAFE